MGREVDSESFQRKQRNIARGTERPPGSSSRTDDIAAAAAYTCHGVRRKGTHFLLLVVGGHVGGAFVLSGPILEEPEGLSWFSENPHLDHGRSPK